MSFVLGVDGGNTKSVAILTRLDGTIVGRGRGGCGDIYNAPSATAALDALATAACQALAEAGARPDQVLAAVFSTAGADWPEDTGFIAQQMRARGIPGRIVVVNDAVGALRAGSPDGTGLIVACGTGAAVGARAAGGQTWHASFWLSNLGGAALGMNALNSVYAAELGLGVATVLTSRILAFYELDGVEELLHRFTSRTGTHPRNAARLARLVMDAAEEEDPVALRLVCEHAASLGQYALVAAHKTGLSGEQCYLVLAGGLFRHHSRLLVDALVEHVRRELPGAEPVRSRLEPVAGALLLAIEEAGVTPDEPLLARLESGMPPLSFFAT